MVNVSEKEKAKYFLDDTHKEMVLRIDDEPGNINGINWYLQDKVVTESTANHWAPDVTGDLMIGWHDEMNQSFFRFADYLYISIRVKWISGPIDNMSLRLAGNQYSSIEAYTQLSTGLDWVKNALTLPESKGLRIFGRVDKANIYKWCHSGDPRYGTGFSTMYLKVQGAVSGNPTTFLIDQYQVQTEYDNYTFDDLYLGEYRYDYEKEDKYGLNYLGLSPYSNNKSISTIPIRPGKYIKPFTNENIKYNSFSLVESICSRDTLHVGSVEAANFRMTICGRNENLSGRYVKPYIYTRDPDKPKPEPFLYNEINWWQGSEEFYPGITKEISFENMASNADFIYNKFFGSVNIKYFKEQPYVFISSLIKIKELDADFTPSKILLYYSLSHRNTGVGWPAYINYSEFESGDFVYFNLFIDTSIYGGITNFNWFSITFCDENKNRITDGHVNRVVLEAKDVRIQMVQSKSLSYTRPYDINDCIEFRGINADDYIFRRQAGVRDDDELIPLGRFLVNDVTKTAHMTYEEHAIEAYDKLTLLSVDATNWYNMYMYGVSMDGYNGGGFEYTRQMYSTYWNLISGALLDNRNKHTEELIYSELNPTYYTEGGNVVKHLHWEIGDDLDWFFENIWYGRVHIDVSEQAADFLSHPLVLDIRYTYTLNSNYGILQGYSYVYSSYRHFVDEFGRGIINKACICVEETLDDGRVNKFLVDNGDYFMLSPNCVSANIWYVHTQYPHTSGAGIYSLINHDITQTDPNKPGIALYSVTDLAPEFINASERLVYYNYDTKEIFSSSGCTALDVMRSLTEINGCFIHSDREGNIIFKHLNKYALYPSETLYPREDLYPRGGDTVLPISSYISSEFSDFKTKDFGKIQVVGSNLSAEDNAVQYEYIDNTNNNTNIYVMDDNVFYCGGKLSYKKDNMPEMDRVFSRMFQTLLSLSYTPNVTTAVGMPWLEVGDRLSIVTNNGGFDGFLLRRTLNGTQNLKDMYEAYGTEYNDDVDSYSYTQYKDTPIQPKP